MRYIGSQDAWPMKLGNRFTRYKGKVFRNRIFVKVSKRADFNCEKCQDPGNQYLGHLLFLPLIGLNEPLHITRISARVKNLFRSTTLLQSGSYITLHLSRTSYFIALSGVPSSLVREKLITRKIKNSASKIVQRRCSRFGAQLNQFGSEVIHKKTFTTIDEKSMQYRVPTSSIFTNKSDSVLCSICEEAEETSEHILFSCSFVTPLISAVNANIAENYGDFHSIRDGSQLSQQNGDRDNHFKGLDSKIFGEMLQCLPSH
ncbi:unnamed protein product [Lepeophtheirus salmonis]|uniref:(salmon louse) hypothetical protein n=1 Tax=Lepeophtheirus salmonis TaxID=72036 RepID=A0A7R8CUD3_LEPSM|nr:unnamed protein product [Lepeophtheirus salmonis]CAF2935599.1 unnamed protein product [Lepeophtheirus salmonis]